MGSRDELQPDWERKMRIRRLLLIGVLACLLAGCSISRPLPIESGLYAVSGKVRERKGAAPPLVEGLQIDREGEELTIILRKGSPLRVPYASRPKSEWPAGCPGNLFSHKMEVFDLAVDEHSRMALGMEHPILVRNCPDTPYQLVLREQGEIGGASTACPYPETCLIFQPATDDQERTCQELELLVEELHREKSVLEEWTDQLVEGYGPGVWYFSESGFPLFHHTVEMESLDGIVRELNQLLAADQLPTLEVEHRTDHTVQIHVSNHLQLTQGLGSSGAQAYLQVVLYTLTSLPEIDCVDFQFPEGDHARPELLCRK